MFDAEIAAKLLNRWTIKRPFSEHDNYLDLLREGNLKFTHQAGRVSLGEKTTTNPFDLESLVFADGSRALRIRTLGLASDWTQWTALEPPVALAEPTLAPSLEETRCVSEAHDR
jgi:hypothetical protein